MTTNPAVADTPTPTNAGNIGPDVRRQLTFSTADIERAVFYGGESPFAMPRPIAPGPVTLVLVAGELRPLEQSQTPPGAVPFTPASSLFRLGE